MASTLKTVLLVITFPLWIVPAIYGLPYLLARSRHHPNRDGILIVNLLLGWTLIGWVAAFAWAASHRPVMAA